MSEAVCRGSWLLGSACGRCARCIEEAPKAFKVIKDERDHLQKRLKSVTDCIPQPSGFGDYNDRIKARFFENAREVLYAKETPIKETTREAGQG